jgi:predicted  nucleic acid-binding Zn-ribbon protein
VFSEKDLPEILKILEDHLKTNNTSAKEINENIQQLIFSSKSTNTSEECSTDTDGDHEQHIPPEVNNDRNQPLLKEKMLTDDNSSPIKDMLKDISSSILDMRRELNNHITKTASQIGEIKDALIRLKSQRQVNSNELNGEVEHIKNNTEVIKEQISSVNSCLVQRLQSISDHLRSKSNVPSNRTAHNKKSSVENKSFHQSHYYFLEMNCSIDTLQPVSAEDKIQDTNQTHVKYIEPSINKINDSDSPTISNRSSRWKTLIVGDSFQKGIHTRGLKNNVDVLTCPGKLTSDVCFRLRNYDLREHKNIVIYVDGYDAANDGSVDKVYEELKVTVVSMLDKCAI